LDAQDDFSDFMQEMLVMMDSVKNEVGASHRPFPLFFFFKLLGLPDIFAVHPSMDRSDMNDSLKVHKEFTIRK
jgi:hypothetical protein